MWAYEIQHKYRLTAPITVDLNELGIDLGPLAKHIAGGNSITLAEGILTIAEGWDWDGPSGPTVDSPSSMRAACLHDAFYDLGRQGLMPEGWRLIADRIFKWYLREDGMSAWRRWLWFRAVRRFAGGAGR